jgi:hypothetical protein
MSFGDSPDMLDYIDHLEAENERLREENAKLKAQLRTLSQMVMKPDLHFSLKFLKISGGLLILTITTK